MEGTKRYVLIWLPTGTEATVLNSNDLTLPETGSLYHLCSSYLIKQIIQFFHVWRNDRVIKHDERISYHFDTFILANKWEKLGQSILVVDLLRMD